MKQFDPSGYHVQQDLGDDWVNSPLLAHIQERIRQHAVPLDALIEDPTNARLHDDQNLEGIRGSYVAFGQRVLVVVNSLTMIVEKGNGSIRALRDAGLEYVAVLFVEDRPTEAVGFSIADNRTAETATWDLPVLFDQLNALDYEVPGIEPAFFEELQALAAADFAPSSSDDDEPDEEAPEPTASVTGETYALGSCLLECGDDPLQCDAIRKLWGAYAKKTKTTPGDGAL